METHIYAGSCFAVMLLASGCGLIMPSRSLPGRFSGAQPCPLTRGRRQGELGYRSFQDLRVPLWSMDFVGHGFLH